MSTRIEGNPAELFAALAKARGEFRKIQKTREVKVQSDRGSYTFSYAELDELIDATVPALSANGLAVFHTRSTNDGQEWVSHWLTHKSGAYMVCQQAIPLTKLTRDGQEVRLSEQEFGSKFTYARRYAYQAILNLAAEDDDDANQADGNRVEERRDKRQAPTPRPEAKAAPAVNQRPASEPPPPIRGRIAEDHSGPPVLEDAEDDRPAQSDEALDKDLSKVFSSLGKDWSIPAVNVFAKKVTGKMPKAWTVSDGRRFLAAYQAGERPL